MNDKPRSVSELLALLKPAAPPPPAVESLAIHPGTGTKSSIDHPIFLPCGYNKGLNWSGYHGDGKGRGADHFDSKLSGQFRPLLKDEVVQQGDAFFHQAEVGLESGDPFHNTWLGFGVSVGHRLSTTQYSHALTRTTRELPVDPPWTPWNDEKDPRDDEPF